mgnify:FL=1
MIKLKKFIFISLFLLISLPTILFSVSRNSLNFYEKDSNLYYRTNKFDSDLFLYKENIRPGNSVSGVLDINNETSHEYSVYLKSVPAQRSPEVENFLENMSIVVKNDGKIVNKGNMLEELEGVSTDNLSNNIYLGKYDAGDSTSLSVTAHLSPDYVPPEKAISTYVDWKFYASFGDDELIEIKKDDGEEVKEAPDKVLNLLYFSLLILIAFLGIIVEIKKKKDKIKEKN